VPEKKKPKPKPEPDKDKKYTWSMHPGPDGKTTVSCHSAQVGGQSILSLQLPEDMLDEGIDYEDFGLRETTEATAFHDETLQQATREINNILRRANATTRSPEGYSQ